VLAPLRLGSYNTLVEFVGVLFNFFLLLFGRLCWHHYAYAPINTLVEFVVLFSFFSCQCFVDFVGTPMLTLL
jgi:hypothetical protein